MDVMCLCLAFLAEGAAYTMTTIIEAITSVFTGVMGMVSSVAQAIVGEPLLLFFCILSLVGIGIGIFSRLKRA